MSPSQTKSSLALLLLTLQSLSHVWLWAHGLQHIPLLCPSLSPGICLNSYLLNWWCYLTISSSVVPFSSRLWYFIICVCAKSFQWFLPLGWCHLHIWDGWYFFVTSWTVACPSLVSLGFSRQEWISCHFVLQGFLLTQGSNRHPLHHLHWQAGSLTLVPPGKPQFCIPETNIIL